MEDLNLWKKRIKRKIVDERTGIEYRLVGDYYIPNITIPKLEELEI